MFAHRKAITRTQSALSGTNGDFIPGFSVYLKFFSMGLCFEIQCMDCKSKGHLNDSYTGQQSNCDSNCIIQRLIQLELKR